MSRRRDERVRVDLDAGGIESLPMADITAIMRGAENIIAQGGRTLLGRILKGSRDKDLLQRGLHENPSWGFYRSLANDEILARIDWTILNGYLRIEYFGRLPLLCYTPAGLEIEIDSCTDELLARLRRMSGTEPDIAFLESCKEMPRATLDRLLEKIEATGDPAFIPMLQSWGQVAYKKPRTRIGSVIAKLETQSP